MGAHRSSGTLKAPWCPTTRQRVSHSQQDSHQTNQLILFMSYRWHADGGAICLGQLLLARLIGRLRGPRRRSQPVLESCS